MWFAARTRSHSRSSSHREVNYEPVGATMPGVRSQTSVGEMSARVGDGEAAWREARRMTLSWGIQRAAGYVIAEVGSGRHEPRLVEPNQVVTLGRRFGPLRVAVPVKVVYVIDEPDRGGFAFGTVSGHPLAGEAAFIVERRADDSVWFVLRSMSKPAGLKGVLGYPLVLLLRPGLERSYRRSFAGLPSI